MGTAIYTYLSYNYVLFFVLLSFVLLLGRKGRVNPLLLKTVLTVICILLVLSIFDFVEQIAASWDSPSALRVLCSSACYCLKPAIPFVLLLAVGKSKPIKVFACFAFIATCLVYLSAFFCDVAFSFDAGNGFHRGPLNFTSLIVGGVFVVLLLVETARKYRTGDSGEVRALVFCAVASVIAALIEIEGAHNLLITIIALSCFFYCCYIHVQNTKKDTLTGLLNRQSYYSDASKFDSSISALLVMDLNGLKEINDTKGHVEGDKALISIADFLMEACGETCRLYRMSGDEFVVMCLGMSEDQCNALLLDISTRVSETGYLCACGGAFRASGDTVSALLHRADKEMYQDKMRHYSQTQFDRRAHRSEA